METKQRRGGKKKFTRQHFQATLGDAETADASPFFRSLVQDERQSISEQNLFPGKSKNLEIIKNAKFEFENLNITP